MSRVSDSVHEAERWLGPEAVATVILDDQASSSDSASLQEKLLGGFAVVDRVHHEDDVDPRIVFGQMLTVISRDFDAGIGSKQHIGAPDLKVGSQTAQLTGKPTVSAAHVQDGDAIGCDRGQLLGQRAGPSFRDESPVELLKPVHRRSIPRRLTKKPEMMVWKPRAASVIPGITPRRVVA